jgi:hypothetical protein
MTELAFPPVDRQKGSVVLFPLAVTIGTSYGALAMTLLANGHMIPPALKHFPLSRLYACLQTIVLNDVGHYLMTQFFPGNHGAVAADKLNPTVVGP